MSGRPGPKPRTNDELLTMSWDILSVNARRRRILLEAEYACTQCHFDKRRHDGLHILEIDHIDGNHRNYDRSNLRVLCPNCHAMTPNFRAHGRSPKFRTSTREFKPGNRGYAVAYQEAQEKQASKIETFKSQVSEAISSGKIDVSQRGWAGKLAHIMSTSTLPIQAITIGRWMKHLLPEVYTHCYHVIPSKKRLKVEQTNEK